MTTSATARRRACLPREGAGESAPATCGSRRVPTESRASSGKTMSPECLTLTARPQAAENTLQIAPLDLPKQSRVLCDHAGDVAHRSSDDHVKTGSDCVLFLVIGRFWLFRRTRLI